MLPEATGPIGAMRELRASVLGRESDLQFQCRRCTQVRRVTWIVLGSLFVAVIAMVLVLDRLGLLAH